MLKPSRNLPEDAAGYLRFLAAEICDELIAMTPDANADAVHAGLDRVHELSEEMWRLTTDMRAPRQ